MRSTNQKVSEGSILIVGADGTIGGALKTKLERDGIPVVGTTRRPGTESRSRVFLDLAGNVDGWKCPVPVGVALICAGVARIADCERASAETRRANVEATVCLARSLAASGAHVVMLSTNQVFDGSRPRRQVDDPVSPVTEYGRQKAEVEGQLLSGTTPSTVVRLTKVLPPRFPLFGDWIKDLSCHVAIHPFLDLVMSPASLAFVVEVLARLLAQRTAGIIQVSGDRDVTYADAAHYVARRLGADPQLVQPRSCVDSGLPESAAPRHTTLDTRRLRDELGLNPPDVWSAIDTALLP
jgi:dTDP-4-dehydrorhamnose reductase